MALTEFEKLLLELERNKNTFVKSRLNEKKTIDRNNLVIERQEITDLMNNLNKGMGNPDEVEYKLRNRGDTEWSQQRLSQLSRIKSRLTSRAQSIQQFQADKVKLNALGALERTNSSNEFVQSMQENVDRLNTMGFTTEATRLQTDLKKNTELAQLNMDIFRQYDDAILDENEQGKMAQLYEEFNVNPNMIGGPKLQQALNLLQSGADPSTVRTQLGQVAMAKPQTVSFNDKTYTQVSDDQVVTEEDGTMHAMMGGNQVKVVDDIAAYPGMKFVTGERYKGTSSSDSSASDPKQRWKAVGKRWNQSTDTYTMYTGTDKQREDLDINNMVNLGKLALDENDMNYKNASYLQYHVGNELHKYIKWAESMGWTDDYIQDELKENTEDNIEHIAEYFSEPGKKEGDEYVLPSGGRTEYSLGKRFKNLDVDGKDSIKLLVKQMASDYKMLGDPQGAMFGNTKSAVEDQYKSLAAKLVEYKQDPTKQAELTTTRKELQLTRKRLKLEFGLTDTQIDELLD